jgi:hypothetical protein
VRRSFDLGDRRSGDTESDHQADDLSFHEQPLLGA